MVDHDSGPTLAYRAKVLRGVLLWRSPGSSAKALGLGIYIIMLLGSIPRALHYMQVGGNLFSWMPSPHFVAPECCVLYSWLCYAVACTACMI
jgi:hypothetical protein